jgi:2-polyprenyl-6-methoxyphenol hydroxylase-like FAD-dependent oxidoreductase
VTLALLCPTALHLKALDRLSRSTGHASRSAGNAFRSGYSNIVWSTTPAHASELVQMGSEEFGGAVNRALEWRQASHPLSLVSPPGMKRAQQPPRVEGWVGKKPASFPLGMQHSGRYAALCSCGKVYEV